MAITRAAERDLLLPGLAAVEGKYPQIARQWSGIFWRGYSRMALERAAEMRFTGLAQLKSEGGATVFDNAPGERFVYNIEMVALGLGTAITREALDDNLYKDSFGPMTIGLAESFAQTEEILHANLLNSGTTYNPAIVGDGVPLFSTVHPIDNGVYANRPSPDIGLNEAGIEYMLQLIRVFPDQAGLRMFTRGRKLVVPIALEFTAERLTKAELRPGTANNDITAFLSAGGLAEGYQVMDYLTSPTAWFVTSTIKGLVSYDRVPFELDLQVDAITGNLQIVGYQRYGLGYRNPRAIAGSFATA
jgi:hypothetical protein